MSEIHGAARSKIMQTGKRAEIVSYSHARLDDVRIGQQIRQSFPKRHAVQLKKIDTAFAAELQQGRITAFASGKDRTCFRIKAENLFLPEKIERAIQILFRADQAYFSTVGTNGELIDFLLAECRRSVRPCLEKRFSGQTVVF